MIILFIIGIGLGFISFLILLSEFQTRQGSSAIRGEVVGFRNPNGSSTKFPRFQTVARYQNYDGLMYYALSGTTSNVPLNFVGEPVTIFVRKNDPSFGKIRSRSSFFIAGACASIGAGCLYFFFRIFEWNLFSIVSSVAILGLITRSIWKAKRSIPLSKAEWMELKKGNETKSVVSEEEKDQIEWIPPESLAVVYASAKAACMKAIPACIIIAVACAGGSFYFYKKTERFLAQAQATQGQVVEMVTSRSHDSNDTYAPMVEFTNPATNSRQRFRHPVSSNPPSYSVGEPVTVLFDPHNPSDARIDSGIWNYALAMMCGAASALFFLITLSHLRSLGKYSSPQRRMSAASRHPPRSA